MGIFLEFVDKKERDIINHLNVLKHLFKAKGFKVFSKFNIEDPYVYIVNKYDEGDFGGIRIYDIGGMLAFRVQQDKDTEPYGKAYKLDVEKMFSDLLSDYSPKKAGKILINTIAKDINNFFKMSAIADRELQIDDNGLSPNNPANRIISRVGGGKEYSNLIYLPK